MSIFLASVPGKLKTLLDRLTSTRAGYLDRIDATVTSAYDSANWSGTKAGYIDAAISTLGLKPQTGLYTVKHDASGVVFISNPITTRPGRFISSGALTSGVYKTMLNVASSGGFLYYLGVTSEAAVFAGGSQNLAVKVTIDGTVAMEETGMLGYVTLMGYDLVSNREYSRSGITLRRTNPPIRFNSSLKIELKSDKNATDEAGIKIAYSLD